ncbi:MAG: polysaccharide biosynthesis tyrosine autokinase [Propionibacteriaceae bacterium]|nr:polysaccharide biosynthesis tyrosine autokinase [Propionibacteriaceae bacterium]
MEFREYLAILRKYWISIVGLTLIGAIAAGAYILVTPPVYTARCQVYLTVSMGSSVSDFAQGSNYATSQARSFAEIARTPVVLDPVIRQLGLETTSAKLATKITATVPTNSSLIAISARDDDPELSAKIAQQVALSLREAINRLTPLDTNDKPVVVGTIVTPAVPPTTPTSPRVLQTLFLGVLIGLALGVGLAVLRKALDIRIHTSKDVTNAVDYPVVGSIPRDQDLAANPVVLVRAPTSVLSERFRQLRTSLLFFNIEDDKPFNFVVTSSLEGEGKTSVAINIAYALAEQGDRVLLIDADLRRPRIAHYLQLESEAGLTTVLLNRARADDVIQSLGPGYPDVLTSGPIPPNPVELVGSHRMKLLLDQVSDHYQAVIVDSAPLLPVADTLSLVPHVSGVLMVAAAEKVTVPELSSAAESVERTSTPIMGVVLNQVRRHGGRHSSYYYYYDQHESATKLSVEEVKETPDSFAEEMAQELAELKAEALAKVKTSEMSPGFNAALKLDDDFIADISSNDMPTVPAEILADVDEVVEPEEPNPPEPAKPVKAAAKAPTKTTAKTPAKSSTKTAGKATTKESSTK